MARREARVGEQVPDHVRLTGLGQMPLGDPGRVGAAHEVDEVGIVHGEHGIEAESRRFDDRRPRRDEPGVQHVAPLGLLVAGLAHTQPVAAIGRVAAVTRRPDHGIRSVSHGARI